MTTLREAAQQALEALGSSLYPQRRQVAAIAALKAALAEPLTNQCGKTCERAKLCAVCACDLAEPVQEPVAWRYQDARGNYRYRGYVQGFDKEYSLLKPVPLYTAPPQRKPLTEEEILKAIGWERAEMYMKLTPNFPVAEAKKETLKNARAIERAHGIGGQE